MTDLSTRVAALSGPDRAVDAEIAEAIGKTPALAARERGGRTRARVVPNASAREIHRFMHRNIEYGSTVHTDEHGGYRRVGGARP